MGKKIFGVKKIWVKKKSGQQILGQKVFESKKNLSKIFFWSIRFGDDIFLSKKTGRVNPRGEDI